MERRWEEQDLAPDQNPPTIDDLLPLHRENGPAVEL
jgi:hypothetical protein